MRNGAAIGVAGMVVISLTLVGGAIFAKYKIKSEIETAFARASENPAIIDSSIGDVTVDLIGDKVVLRGAEGSLNLEKIAKAYGNLPGDMTVTGTLTEHFDTTTLTGVRELLFGETEIKSFVANGGSYSLNMTQGFKKQGDQVTLNTTGTGSIARISGQGWNLANILNPGSDPHDIWNVPIKAMQMDNAAVDITISGSAPLKSTSPSAKLHYTLAHGEAENMARDHIGLFSFNNLGFQFDPAETNKSSLKFTIDELAVKDAKIDNLMLTEGDFNVTGLKFPIPENPDPKEQMLMALLDMDQIALDIRVNFALDDKASTFMLKPFSVRVHKLGALDLNMDASGLPPMAKIEEIRKKAITTLQTQSSDSDPKLASQSVKKINAEYQALFADTAVSDIMLGYKDEGALKTFMTSQASKAGGDINRVAQTYAVQASSLVSAAYSAEKANEVQKKLAAFLSAPSELHVSLSSAQPVKINDLKKSFSQSGPEALSVFQLDVTSP